MTATMSSTAFAASNGTAVISNAAPHRKNAARQNRSVSPYQQRTSQKDNPTQQLIKQAVDYLIQQLEAGKSETLTAYLGAMARFHSYSATFCRSADSARQLREWRAFAHGTSLAGL